MKILSEEVEFVKNNYLLHSAEWCAEQLKCKKTKIFYILKKIGLKKEYPYKSNIDQFINIGQPEIAYFLGFYWADGSKPEKSSIRMEIKKSDGENLSEIFNMVGNFKKTYRQRYKDNEVFGKEQIRLRLVDKNFSKFLTECDYDKKSYCSPTKILSKIPENLKHYWWRGYLDGDGCIFAPKKIKKWGSSVCFWGAISQDWTDLIELCIKLNIFYKVVFYERKNNTKIYKSSSFIISRKEDVVLLLDYIYMGDNIGLQRKREIYLKIKEYINNTYSNKKTGSIYKGVFFSKKLKRWRARIKQNKIIYQLGEYSTEKEAANAYNDEAIKRFGQCAILNKIN